MISSCISCKIHGKLVHFFYMNWGGGTANLKVQFKKIKS